MNEKMKVDIIRDGENMIVPFCALQEGDVIPSIPCRVAEDAHYSGDATCDRWLFYDDSGESWFPEDILQRLNTALYEKMFEEQENFRYRLLEMSPCDVLDHAYEYATREDIMLSREYHDLTADQCRVMLKKDNLLDALYQEYQNRVQSRMAEIDETTECYANALLRIEYLNRKKEEQKK